MSTNPRERKSRKLYTQQFAAGLEDRPIQSQQHVHHFGAGRDGRCDGQLLAMKRHGEATLRNSMLDLARKRFHAGEITLDELNAAHGSPKRQTAPAVEREEVSA